MSNRPSAPATICRRAVISPDYTFYSCFVGTDDSCHYSCRRSGGHSEMQGTILTACTCHINYASIFSLIGQDRYPYSFRCVPYVPSVSRIFAEFNLIYQTRELSNICFREITVPSHGQVAEHPHIYSSLKSSPDCG